MKRETWIGLSLLAFYTLLFLPLLGHVHLFDWDEINFAEAAREMLLTGDWLNVQINYEPFWEKPPFFIWMQALSMSVFGNIEFAARFPNFLVGLVTVALIYQISLKQFGIKTSIITVLVYLASLTPHLYFKSGIIDPLFNLFMFLAVYQLFRGSISRKNHIFFFAGIFLGFAVLTKGPVALLIVGLTGLAYRVYYQKRFYSLSNLFVLAFGLIIVPGIWMGLQFMEQGWWFIKEFVSYQVDLFWNPVASHGQPFYYHAVVLLVACFPLTILALPGLFKTVPYSGDRNLIRWMKCLFWVVLILFSLVTTKIVHYSSMCYIPLAFLAGISLNNLSLNKTQKSFLFSVGLLLSAVLGLIMLVLSNFELRKKLSSMINDKFLNAQLLNSSVELPLVAFIPVLMLFVLVLYLIWNYSKLKLMTYLLFQTLSITFLLTVLVPSIEMFTQKQWVDQLNTYKNKNMVHFTVGFKSYAHLFYTEQSILNEHQALKDRTLNQMGIYSWYELDHQQKKEYDTKIRHAVVHESNIPCTISIKAGKQLNDADLSILEKVFEGNGYVLYERKKTKIGDLKQP